MKNALDLEKAVAQTLESLSGIQQVEANDYMAAKAWQRMKENQRLATVTYRRLMLRLAIVLLLFVGINTASFVWLKNRPAVSVKQTTGADAFAEAYSLNSNTDNY